MFRVRSWFSVRVRLRASVRATATDRLRLGLELGL